MCHELAVLSTCAVARLSPPSNVLVANLYTINVKPKLRRAEETTFAPERNV